MQIYTPHAKPKVAVLISSCVCKCETPGLLHHTDCAASCNDCKQEKLCKPGNDNNIFLNIYFYNTWLK